jgi:transcriptional regulator with XRE-family HTH domain
VKRFGEKMRHLRKRRHMTLKKLAQILGLTAHGHLSELENGKKIPTTALVMAIANLFEVSTDTLLRDEIELPPEQDNL